MQYSEHFFYPHLPTIFTHTYTSQKILDKNEKSIERNNKCYVTTKSFHPASAFPDDTK